MRSSTILLTVYSFVLCFFETAWAQTNTFPSTGNVGIGTLSPAQKLTVKTDGIGLTQESAGGAVKIGFWVNSTSGYLQTHTNHPLHFTTNNGSPQMSLLTSGNFGIGTSSPGERLTVQSATNVLGFAHTDGTVKLGSQLNSSGTYIGAMFGTTSNHPLFFRTNNNAAPQITLLQNGNVGIGKTNPGKLLDVEGDIFVNGVIVGKGAGPYSTRVGEHALDAQTSGGIWNSAFGAYSLAYNKTGYANTAIGCDALGDITTGNGNTAVGNGSLYQTDSIQGNVAMGDGAGDHLANGTYNSIMLGYYVTATASNQVRIGDNYMTSIGGYANWTNISDGRVKKNINENVPGLSFINKLAPVTYTLNLDEAERITGSPKTKQRLEPDEKMQTLMTEAKIAKEKIVYSGFIAQDVEKAAHSLSYDFSGVDAVKNDKDLYGLRYAEFVVPLVKSVQELSRMNDEKDKKIEDLQQQIDELRKIVTGEPNKSTVQVKLSSAALEQNTPNPFSSTTTIGYTLPLNYMQAKIVVTDKAGKRVKEINLSGTGSSSIKLNTVSLSAGSYQYSLYVDGSLIDTKQMIQAK